MTESTVVEGFLPSRNGLRFANRFPPGPTLRIGPLDPRWIGIGDAAAGLCGGMAWLVRAAYEAGRPIPTDETPPANGSPLFRAIVRAQIRSLDWFRTSLRFWWMGGISSARALGHTQNRAWPRIRREIDAGRLPLVGLVRHRGWNPWAMTTSHQVLAYGYSVEGGSVTMRVYDPNWPMRDDITLTLDATGVRQSTGEAVTGLIVLG